MAALVPGTKPIAFVATSHPEQALAFYRDVLGLALVEDSPFAIVFDAFGTMLRVQKAQGVSPAPYTAFGFDVPDIVRTVRSLASAGVAVIRYPHFELDELGIWTSPAGGRICWFHDPDGNVLSLTQF